MVSRTVWQREPERGGGPSAGQDLPGNESLPYLSNAPSALISLHAKLQSSAHRQLLERLLTDPRMDLAWHEIEKRLSTDLSKQPKAWRGRDRVPASQHKKSAAKRGFEASFRMTDRDIALRHMESEYENLWLEILYAVSRSSAKRPLEPRARIRVRFLRIGRDAEKLAGAIAETQLDFLAYEYFPDDLARAAFKVKNWHRLAPDARNKKARRRLGGASWPSMTDLLVELAKRADQVAKEAFTKRRIVDRDTWDRSFNYFIRHLNRAYFSPYLHGPMDKTLARIATVVFNKEFDQESVRRARRHFTV